MFPDRGHNHSRTLLFSFLGQHTSHKYTVIIIQVTDRFIQKDEVKRLA